MDSSGTLWPVRLIAHVQDERFSYIVLRRGGRRETGAPHAISRRTLDAADMHDPQPYIDQQPRSWRKSEARYQRALALEDLMRGESGHLYCSMICTSPTSAYVICGCHAEASQDESY